MYNQFIATRKKVRRPATESNTAGAAKVSSGGGKSRGELEALATRHGWAPRSLGPEDVQGMGADELRYHEIFNSVALERALTLPGKTKHGKDVDEQWKAKRIWEDRASPEETQAAIDEVAKFTRAYPQFRGCDAENRKKLMDYMKERNAVVNFSNLVAAFEALALEGSISLSPAAISAGPESTVRGRELTTHHSFHLLLQPQKRASDVDRMSADEFKSAHPELHDTRVPFLVAVRERRAANDAAHQRATEAVTASSGATKVVDYPLEQHGFPAEPDKYSFKQKIRSMSATEFAQRCQLDRALRKLLDEKE
jgi:hypothetical protein